MCLRHCLIRTAGGGVCFLVNIIIQKAGKEVRGCEVTRVVRQLSIVCSRSQIASMIVGRSADWESSNIIMIFG